MSSPHDCTPHPREWLARWNGALLLECCAALAACTSLGNLDGYSSGRDGFAGSSSTDTNVSGLGSSSLPSAPLDAGLAARPASGIEDAGPPADPGPPLADDVANSVAPSPRISSTVPGDGATGVRRDTSLTIAFSQPMDRVSVEAAFVSDSLPAATPEFRWDAEGTLLNIVLGAPLSYAIGEDASQVSALRYDYRVTGLAHDLSGHALPETQVSFSTLREIHIGLGALADPALTGNWRSDDTYGTDSCAQGGGNMCIGDSSFGPDASYRGFVSFDVSPLAVATELLLAEFSIDVGSILGDPFASLGQLQLEHLTFAAIGPDAFVAPVQAAIGTVAAAQAGNNLSIDALGPVRADVESQSSSQYRLRFQTPSDGDGSTDLLFATRASATLRLVYLIP